MEKQLNIEELESRLKQFAHNASLGATDEWDDLVYEWLGQTLTIGFDQGKNEFPITLVLVGGKVEVRFDALDDAPQDSLRDTINYMVEHCRDSIINYGAELTRLNIRIAMGC